MWTTHAVAVATDGTDFGNDKMRVLSNMVLASEVDVLCKFLIKSSKFDVKK